MAFQQLKIDQLYAPGTLKPDDKRRLVPTQAVIGQDRALTSLNFGIQLQARGYNIFCIGPKGVGRTTLSIELIRQHAATQNAPNDWCYVYNFSDPRHPLPLTFAPEKGKLFECDINKTVDCLRQTLIKTFTGEAYKIQIAHINQKTNAEKEAYLALMQDMIASSNVVMVRLTAGLSVAPAKNGVAIAPEIFNNLPTQERRTTLEQMAQAQKKLEDALKKMPRWDEKHQQEISALNAQFVRQIAESTLKSMREAYGKNKDVIKHLDQMQQHLIDNADLLVVPGARVDESFASKMRAFWSNFSVNTLVSHTEKTGAPVVHLDHPTLPNLLGKIEYLQQSGTLITDHSLIRAGALHSANGGYLVIEARDLLENPTAWSALKRCLFARSIKMDAGAEDGNTCNALSLAPNPIPLEIKIILIGEANLYYALTQRDDEFSELFKIQSRFVDKMPRTRQTELDYAKTLTAFIARDHLRPFTIGALNRVIEHSARMAQDRHSLSTYITHVHDVMREANFIAASLNKKQVDTEHVQYALDERMYRNGAVQSEMMALMQRGILKIATQGKQVGQLNALVIHDYGAFSFGRPTRLSCQTRLGRGDVIDIEREVSLGGTFHTKGVLVLSSFIAARYAQSIPLSMDASLIWEQSYNEIEGDSASSGELYCLLSAIANVPINQALAATGAVNQLGEVQAIGGVNEKIEGYFDVCEMQGLTGKQGVIIPTASMSDLMLAPRVRDAIKNDKFHVYAVDTVDEAMTLLTGMTPKEFETKIQTRLKKFFSLAQQACIPPNVQK